MTEQRDTGELWAWMVLPSPGHPGGVMSMSAEPGPAVALTSTQRWQMLALRPQVELAVRQSGHTAVLQRFTLAEVEDVITPTLLEPL